MVKFNPTLVIGIAGGTGSGKTTVANEILTRVGPEIVSYVPHDAYYKDFTDLPPNQKAEINYDHPHSLDTPLMTKHIQSLIDGKAIKLPVYDFTNHSRTDQTIPIQPNPVILVEGILIFTDPVLRELCDVKIFVDTDADIRLIRRIRRDITERGRTIESVLKQYETTVRPMHLEFVEPAKRYADIIIPKGGYNQVALDMVIARIETMVRKIKKKNKKKSSKLPN
ncbi:uridine kinase [Candidatus Saccharibacteria bacterium]|nr:uridine kinase [Candidatus Saccharibacteria bacterium]